jgi:hypothetical protein
MSSATSAASMTVSDVTSRQAASSEDTWLSTVRTEMTNRSAISRCHAPHR